MEAQNQEGSRFQQVLTLFEQLTDRERASLFENYCRHCGTMQPWHPKHPKYKGDNDVIGCQCWNDE